MYNSIAAGGAANSQAGSRLFLYEVEGLRQIRKLTKWITRFVVVAVCLSQCPIRV